MIAVLAAVATSLLVAAALPRWLRVAQREHYLAPATIRFAARWWRSDPLDTALLAAAAVAVVASVAASPIAVVTGVLCVLAPRRLGLRGRTSKLVWTRRLRTTAALVAVIDLAAVAAATLLAGAHGAASIAALLAVVQPAVVDAALAVAQPAERRAQRRWVTQAERRLRAAAPTTVAITGSYGKTSTKQLVRHLVSGSRSVLASPASFNNTNGLARTLNEHLAPGTEVFVAEMGMYGPGEIRSMCAWVRPTIGVITAIGPVHLERVGSLDGIVAAKSEIVEGTQVAVLNVDARGMAELAYEVETAGQRVVRCSTSDPGAEVLVRATDATGTNGGSGGCVICVNGVDIAELSSTTTPHSNLACAIGVAIALGVPTTAIASRLHDLPQPEHRQAVSTTPTGVTVVDNTFSSNPASGQASLALLARTARPGHKVVVVTPGMIELGPLQPEENQRFAKAAAAIATDLVVVGRTNRRDLVAGASGSRAQVHLVDTRDDAVAWVRAQLTAGDTVLYENDLPDHHP